MILRTLLMLGILKGKNLNGEDLSYVKNLLRMSIEAYKKEAQDVATFKLVYSYGFEKDGLRSKVFKSGKTVVIATKGTTLYFHGIGLGPTGMKDREMDNLMFGVCHLEEKGCEYKKKVKIDNLGYLKDLENLIQTTRRIYPGHKIVLTGHSLGAALSSLMSLRFNIPAIVFSSPGEKYVSQILGFTQKNSLIIHIGICEDTLFLGECGSLCTLMGYSINTTCHLGQTFCLGLENKIIDVIKNDSLKYHRAEILLEHLSTNSSALFEIECTGY